MIKNKININNPLTVIAIFSMLTEASAAASLPYIDSENQKIYVWFLIVFPSFLITLFFLTLNFNNKTLYTPADLSKERATLAAPASTEAYPDQSIAESNNHTDLSPSGLLSQPGIKFSSCSPLRYIFLHQPPKYRPHNLKAAAYADNTPFNLSEVSSTRTETTAFKHFHLIDLNCTAWQLTPKNTLNDVLRKHFKLSQLPKSSTHKNDLVLLLTDTASEVETCLQYTSISKHKSAALFGQATVLTYNIETRQLNRLRSP